MKKYFDEVLPNLIPIRVILNSFNFGDNVWIHKDSDAEGFYTCIMYLNPYWDINWGGDTVFVNDKKDSIIEAIYPKPGRFVLFDSRIQHGPRSLSREAHLPRVGITFLCKVG
jgi:Rps23 Pro-64 3,4-dihydroxylase Tpa1-like proline 4-hydroxylase